ncbi:MAG: class I SAM-dependent methyltransferase [Planctomycetota bacterium]|nr:class I SAM-dependent methyltransferase [Planctomycetota bacterium]MDA1105817.1 class I SAM-dependent methyltransferase [Planctomycetota bacterium]
MHVGATSDLILTLAGDEAAFTPEGRALVRVMLTGTDPQWAQAMARTHRHAVPHARLRKWSVWQFLLRLADEEPRTVRQLIVPGAGWSPLAIDWLATNPHARAWELDIENVEAKRALVQKHARGVAPRWRNRPCDAADPGAVSSALSGSGWDATQPTTWVMEGLLYYIAPAAAISLIRTALASHPDSRMIAEVGLPYDSIHQPAGDACRDYHDQIARAIGRDHLHTHQPTELAAACGARVEAIMDPATASRLRGDSPPAFVHPLDSTQRVVLLAPAISLG